MTMDQGDIAPWRFGDHVIFHDENQHEIRGIVRDREDYQDRIILLIELDAGGYYRATVIKK